MRIGLEGVVKSYPLAGGGQAWALDGIDLVLESGEVCYLTGASGSGKTSLLAVIGGLARLTAGRVLYDGNAERPLPGVISFSFQEPVFVPELTVRENLYLPASCCWPRPSLQRVDFLLEQFGLDAIFDQFPSALSGGEKRRLDLARALLLPSRLLLLDEPTAYLDKEWQNRAMALILAEVRSNGSTLLVATHELLPEAEGARCLFIERGKVIDHGNN